MDVISKINDNAKKNQEAVRREQIIFNLERKRVIEDFMVNIDEILSLLIIRSMSHNGLTGDTAIICATNEEVIYQYVKDILDGLGLDYIVEDDSYCFDYLKLVHVDDLNTKEKRTHETFQFKYMFKLLSVNTSGNAYTVSSKEKIESFKETLDKVYAIYENMNDVFYHESEKHNSELFGYNIVQKIPNPESPVNQFFIEVMWNVFKTKDSLIKEYDEIINPKEEPEENTSEVDSKVKSWFNSVTDFFGKIKSPALKSLTSIAKALGFILKWSIKLAILAVIFVSIWGVPKFI
jgi:hypothetical protein